MPILRIAPICNGKIYVVPNHSSSRENNWLDIPIHEHLQTTPSPTGKTALKLKERYHAHIHTSEQPRFCVKYRDKSEHTDTVYILATVSLLVSRKSKHHIRRSVLICKKNTNF